MRGLTKYLINKIFSKNWGLCKVIPVLKFLTEKKTRKIQIKFMVDLTASPVMPDICHLADLAGQAGIEAGILVFVFQILLCQLVV